jgi:hypothetical protein
MIGKSWGILRRGPIVTASNLHLSGQLSCRLRLAIASQPSPTLIASEYSFPFASDIASSTCNSVFSGSFVSKFCNADFVAAKFPT